MSKSFVGWQFREKEEELQKQGTPFYHPLFLHLLPEPKSEKVLYRLSVSFRALQSLLYFVNELSLSEQKPEENVCVQSMLEVEFRQVPMCFLFARETLSGNQFDISMSWLPLERSLDDQTATKMRTCPFPHQSPLSNSQFELSYSFNLCF